eukprot:gene6999-14239_t
MGNRLVVILALTEILFGSNPLNSSCYDILGTLSTGIVGDCNNALSGPYPNGIFFHGKYIQLGINAEGGFGSVGIPPSHLINLNNQLGFVSDFDRNGYDSLPNPSYAGDYFLPGTPIEGYLIQFNNVNDEQQLFYGESLMGRNNLLPIDFKMTSRENMLSSLIVTSATDNIGSSLKISKISKLDANKQHIITSVVVVNIGSVPMNNFYYGRIIDPDQEFNHYGTYKSNNYVKYQSPARDGSDALLQRSYRHPQRTNAALVVFTGKNNQKFFGSIGTVHPYGRVAHFGMDESDFWYTYADGSGNRVWTQFGGNDMRSNSLYTSRMRSNDESCHLVYNFPMMMPGEVIQFQYFHLMYEDDMEEAFSAIQDIIFLQPSYMLSGNNSLLSILCVNTSIIIDHVEFLLFATSIVSTPLNTPNWHTLGVASKFDNGTYFKLNFNSYEYMNGAAHLKAIVYTNTSSSSSSSSSSTTMEIDKVVSISNIEQFQSQSILETLHYIQSDLNGSFIFYTDTSVILEINGDMTYVTSISFYLEYFDNDIIHSSFIETITASPWQVIPPIYTFESDIKVFIRALITSSINGIDSQLTLVFSGITHEVNFAPTDIILSTNYIFENSVNNSILAYFNTSDPDPQFDTVYIYTLIDSAGGLVYINKNTLVLKQPITLQTVPSGSFTIRVHVSDQEQENCCLMKDLTVWITHVPLPPLGLYESTFYTLENATIGTILGQLHTIDAEVNNSFIYTFVGYSGPFIIDAMTGDIIVANVLDYESTSQYSIVVNIQVNIIDPDGKGASAPIISIYEMLTINIGNVYSHFTALRMLCVHMPCSVNETAAVGTIIGNMITEADIMDQMFTYSVTDDSYWFGVTATGEIFVNQTLDHRLFSYTHSVTVRSEAAEGGRYCSSCVFTLLNTDHSNAFFSISNSTTGEIRIITSGLNFFITSSFRLYIRVTDTTSGLYDDSIITIILNKMERAPLLVPIHNVFGTIARSAQVGTVVGEAIVPIVYDPTMTLIWSITNEITITCTQNPNLKSSANYTISIIETKNPPLLQSPLNFTVREDLRAYETVGEPLRLYWSDVDPKDSDPTFYISDYGIDKRHTFSIDNSTGQISLTGSMKLKYNIQRIYKYIVKVYDSSGLSASSSVYIYIQPILDAPVFGSIPRNLMIGSSSGGNGNGNGNGIIGVQANTNIVINYVHVNGQPVTFAATDNQNTQIDYKIISVDGSIDDAYKFYCVHFDGDNSTFHIAGNTSSKTTTFDYKIQSLYTLNISASNIAHTSYILITIHVQNINVKPFLLSNIICSISMQATVGTYICPIIATDRDDINDPRGWGTLTYTLVPYTDTTTNTATMSNINTNTSNGLYIQSVSNIGELRLSSSQVTWFVTGGVTQIRVLATDGGGLNTSSVVSVTVVRERYTGPPCSAIQSNFNVSENASVGWSVGSIWDLSTPVSSSSLSTMSLNILSGNINNVFTLNNITTGEIKTTQLLNYTAIPSYTLLIQLISDSSSSIPLSTYCPVHIHIEQVYKTPLFSSVTLFVDEHIPSGYLTTGGKNINPLEVRNTFKGKLILKKGYDLDFMFTSSYIYESTWSDGISTLLATITIRIIDFPQAPILYSSSFTIAEDQIGAVGFLNATDSDYEKVLNFTHMACRDRCGLKYSIVQGSFGAFEINANTGELYIKPNTLDYENIYKYTLTVSVRDVSGLTSTNVIHITISDNVNDCYITSITTDSNGYYPVLNANTLGMNQIYISGRKFGPTRARMIYDHMNTNTKTNNDIHISAFLRDKNTLLASSINIPILCDMYRTSVIENTMLNCTLPAGGGSALGVVLTISVNYPTEGVHTCTTSLSSSRMSYAPPVLMSVTTAEGSLSLVPSGGSIVYITGSHFGAMNMSMNMNNISNSNLQLSYDNEYITTQIVPCTIQIPDTFASCIIGVGIGTDLAWRVIYNGQSSNIIHANISYASPLIHNVTIETSSPSSTSTSTNELSTLGGDWIIITGNHFGGLSSSVQLLYGINYYNINNNNNALEYTTTCTVTISQKALRCLSNEGAGNNLIFQIFVGAQSSGFFHTHHIGYKQPILTAISGPGACNAHSSGGDLIYLSGMNFGISSMYVPIIVTYGVTGVEYEAQECVVYIAHVSIRCVMASGTGGNLTWIATVANQSSPQSTFLSSYGQPVILSLNNVITNSSNSNGNIQVIIGQSIDIIGYNFGASYNMINTVQYESMDTRIVTDITSKCSLLIPHTTIRCTSLSISTSSSTSTSTSASTSILLWTVVVNSLRSPSYMMMTSPASSIPPPAITSISGPGVLSPITGGYHVVIHGTNFGGANSNTNTSSEDIYATYGPSGTENRATNCIVYTNNTASNTVTNTVTNANATMICYTVSGVGTGLHWIVHSNGQSSAPSIQSSSYIAPTITSISPLIISTNGATKVTLTGVSFNAIYIPNIYINGIISPFSSALTSTINGTICQFYIPEAILINSHSIPIQIEIGAQRSNIITLSYMNPVITSVHTLPGGFNGSLSLVIQGYAFTRSPTVTLLLIIENISKILNCVSQSQTEIVCHNLDPILTGANVTVTVAGVSSNSVHFSFDNYSPIIMHQSFIIGSARTSGYSADYPSLLQITGQYFGGGVLDAI